MVTRLAAALDTDPELTVNLETETVTHRTAGTHAFRVDPFRKEMLLRGHDDIAWTEERGARIASFEERQRTAQPWLWTRGER